MITFYRTINVSRRVFDLVDEALEYERENGLNVAAWLETFNNCREQGFYLTVIDASHDKHYIPNIYIWAHECRNSDEIVVRWQNESPDNGMFNEETYNKRTKYFHCDEEHKAADCIVDLILERYKLLV